MHTKMKSDENYNGGKESSRALETKQGKIESGKSSVRKGFDPKIKIGGNPNWKAFTARMKD